MKTKKKKKEITIVSYNIHQGLTTHKRKLPFSVIKEAVYGLNGDIFLLQEVAGKVIDLADSPYQMGLLFEETYPFSVYQKNIQKKKSFHGNAIISRYPIASSEFLNISLRGLMKRGVIHSIVNHPSGTRIHFLAVHLGLLQFERKKQIKKLEEYIHRHIPSTDSVILGGDFNDWRQRVSKSLELIGLEEVFLFHQFKHARTFPSLFPILHLDRIYFRNLTLLEAYCVKGKPWNLFSDHLPVVARFGLF